MRGTLDALWSGMKTNQQKVRSVYVARNANGEGYAPDFATVGEVIADLVNNYGGVVLCSGEITAVECDDGIIILTADANGPWSIKCSAEDVAT